MNAAATRRLQHIARVLNNISSSPTAAMSTASKQKVTFASENAAGDGEGVLIGDGSQCKQGLIVIHEWWGLTGHIQDTGAAIAKDGNFTVLVPDMYRGKIADDREQAGHLMTGLDWPGALQDITAAAKFLKSKGCTKVGVTGFCMGGALALAAAVRCPEISAAAPFYGIPNPQLADLTKIAIPVQGHFGQKDDIVGFSSPQDYLPMKEKLVAAGVQLELFEYPTGHAFTNPSSDNYVKEIADLAMDRLRKFMQEKLQ